MNRSYIGQKLERDQAAELGVLGFLNDAHPAAAKLFKNAVVGNYYADHLMLGATGSFLPT